MLILTGEGPTQHNWLTLSLVYGTRDINNAMLVDTVIKNGQIIDRSKLDLPVKRRPATQ